MQELKIKRNISFKNLTTFKVGGKARYFCELRNEEELIEVMRFAKEKSLPIFVLGGGSDILISDKGFDGLVIRYKGAEVSFIDENGQVLVTAEAGLVWDKLVEMCIDKNLQGIECLSGIPGSVGAAPIQNIGAYGQELKDTFIELNAYDLKKGKFVKLQKNHCEFAYRESIFKKPEFRGRFLIINLTLRLKKDNLPTLTYESLINYLKERKIKNPGPLDVRKAVLYLRGQKIDDPEVLGNAGSFFKNPIISENDLIKIQKEYPDIPYHINGKDGIKLFAGWLIEKAGWKGKKFKNAAVSEKSALVITNPKGKAKASEVRELADEISSGVYRNFGVKLEPEVQFIGFGK